MEEKYIKAITCITDAMKEIDCVNLSMGAIDRMGFSWIVNNLETFKQEAITNYNRGISLIMRQLQLRLYFIVYEKKDSSFSAVEKHLGIWHRFKNATTNNKSKDFYISDTSRYAFEELESLSVEQIPMLLCGDLVFLKDETEITRCLENLTKDNSVFDCFYNEGYLLATLRDLWTDGNAVVFYSKNKRDLSKIVHIAQEESFIIK